MPWKVSDGCLNRDASPASRAAAETQQHFGDRGLIGVIALPFGALPLGGLAQEIRGGGSGAHIAKRSQLLRDGRISQRVGLQRHGAFRSTETCCRAMSEAATWASPRPIGFESRPPYRKSLTMPAAAASKLSASSISTHLQFRQASRRAKALQPGGNAGWKLAPGRPSLDKGDVGAGQLHNC